MFMQIFLLLTVLKMLPVLAFTEYFTYQLLYKKYFITIFIFCRFFCMLLVNF